MIKMNRSVLSVLLAAAALSTGSARADETDKLSEEEIAQIVQMMDVLENFEVLENLDEAEALQGEEELP